MVLKIYNRVLYHLGTKKNPYITFSCTALLQCRAGLSLAHLIQGDISNMTPLFKTQIQRPIFMGIIVAMF